MNTYRIKRTNQDGGQYILWMAVSDGIQSSVRPGPRGGHQMCMDAEKQTLFLLGGWDGSKSWPTSGCTMYQVHSGIVFRMI